MFDDEYELNDDDFNDDGKLSLIDNTKLKVIEQIKKYTKLVEEAITFQEPSEYEINFRILSRYISAMVDLNSLETGGVNNIDEITGEEASRQLSDEEILVKIKEIEDSIMEISHKNLREISEDTEDNIATLSIDEIRKNINKSNDSDSNDGSLDF